MRMNLRGNEACRIFMGNPLLKNLWLEPKILDSIWRSDE